MTKIAHPTAGTFAILTIATLWVSTVLSELIGSETTVFAMLPTMWRVGHHRCT
jgi:hypothetical protein